MLPDKYLSSRRYYDLLPSESHACGDIWQGLSSGGLLGTKPIKGVVVTPACDLSARKSETITYLPVIPVRTYFSTLGALPEMHRRVQGYLKAGQLPLELPWKESSFVPPKLYQIESAIKAIDDHLAEKQRGINEATALKKVVAGLSIVRAISEPELSEVPSDYLEAVFGSEWKKTKQRVATNSFSSYLHFLPSDEQDPAYAGLTSHSVVLFRYPLTVPIEIFDLAQQSTASSWPDAIAQTEGFLPSASNYRETRPIKVLSLRPDFLHDLLTRYVAVYNRIGSPDFSRHSVDVICDEMDRT